MIVVVLHEDCLDLLLFSDKKLHKFNVIVQSLTEKNNNNDKIKTIILYALLVHTS